MRLVTDYVRVAVPATTVVCNSREGEHLGVALELSDTYSATITTGASRVTATGPSKDYFPRDDQHPTICAILATFDYLQAPHGGVQLIAQTHIPPAVGLGSHTAACVAGIVIAWEALGKPQQFTVVDAVAVAVSQGVSAVRAYSALAGGIQLSWDDDVEPRACAIPAGYAGAISLLVPDVSVTERSKCFGVGPVAVLAQALGDQPQLLPDVTARIVYSAASGNTASGGAASGNTASGDMLAALRAAHWPAIMAGSGPALLIFGEVSSAMAQSLWAHRYQVIATNLSNNATLA